MNAFPGMEVFEHQSRIRTSDDRSHGRKLNSRQDILVEPGIGTLLLEKAHRMQQQKPGRLQAALASGEEIPVIAATDMLEHADRDNAIERLGDLAVIDVAELDGQPGAEPPTQFDLLARYGDADDFDPIMLGGIASERAKTDADVQDALARLQLQFAADQFELVTLRRFERVCTPPVTAGIGHVRVEHDLK